jgi:WhiB family transcriptional regulator, redox-sensing transcriptional regulator
MAIVTLPWPGLPHLPRARCKDTSDPDAWFSNDMDVLTAAQLVCARCPERGACLAFAVEHDITIGVWGGLLPGERGRPARHQAAG